MKRLRSGFTLIEVLLAIALLLSLTGAMFGFLFGILSTRARALEHVRQHDAANTLIRQLDADLASCVMDDQRNGSGIKGDQTTLRILTRGVAIKLAAQGADNPDVLGDL